MIESLLGRIAQAGTFRSLFQAAASFLALATVGAWMGFGAPSLAAGDLGDDRLAALGASPLAVVYRALNFLSIPHEWVSTVGAYLADDPVRANAIVFLASVLGIAVTCNLSPTRFFPSLQASIWWVCAAVTVQCGSFGWMLAGLFLWIVYRLVYKGRARFAGRARFEVEVEEVLLGLIQLVVAVVHVPLMSLRLIYDRGQ